jgi:RNA polymerase sigma-70 factor (ECF subfamily)
VPALLMSIPDDRAGQQLALNAAKVSALTDAELMERVRRGDEIALAALYDRYAGLILTVALRIVGDRELAEEVMQDSFLRVWNASDTYRASRGQVSGWLIGITRNRAIDMLRSRLHKTRLRERTPLPEPGDEDRFGVEDETEAVVTRQAVADALAGLSMAQRQVVELAYYGGMSQSEIAHQLGEPLGTIKSRTRVSMEHLRTALRPHFRPDDESDSRS